MSRGINDVPFKRRTRLPFVPVAVTRADTITVPSGYTATTFIPWARRLQALSGLAGRCQQHG